MHAIPMPGGRILDLRRVPSAAFSVEDRFWSRVDRRGDDECWPWLWGCGDKGYGKFFVKAGELGLDRDGNQAAHRVAFFLIQGHWPDPFGLHGCDNPPCCNAVNPEHVHEGDASMNMREIFIRDRQGPHRRSGETHCRAKFTNQQVRDIRARYAAGGVRFIEIAAEYGVSGRAISLIVHRQRYGEVI